MFSSYPNIPREDWDWHYMNGEQERAVHNAGYQAWLKVADGDRSLLPDFFVAADVYAASHKERVLYYKKPGMLTTHVASRLCRDFIRSEEDAEPFGHGDEDLREYLNDLH